MNFSSEQQFDIAEGVGRRHLQDLSNAADFGVLSGNVTGTSHDIKRFAETYRGPEFLTTYRTAVFQDIHEDILQHDVLPEYFWNINWGLASALVTHCNMLRPRAEQMLRPDPEDLRMHLDGAWLGLQHGRDTDGKTEDVTVLRTPSDIRLVLKRHVGTLSLDYVRTRGYSIVRGL